MKALSFLPAFLAAGALVSLTEAALGAPPGELDLSFVPDARSGTVMAVAEQPDGRVLIGGYFGVIRLLEDGRTDPTFAASLVGWPYPGIPMVNAIAAQPDGKILVGGQFMTDELRPLVNLVRLLPDGTRDLTFSSGSSPDWPVEAIALQPDGRGLIGGRFEHVGATPVKAVARLMPDGRFDASFDPGAGPNEFVLGMVLQPDGRILVRGNFSTFDGAPRQGVARLLPNGRLDPGFRATAISSPWVTAIALRGTEIYLAGYLSFGGEQPVARLVRLLADGTLDSRVLVEADTGIQAIGVQKDGRVIVGGFFRTLAGAARAQVTRINSNGKVDPGFDCGEGLAGQIDFEWAAPGVYCLSLLSNGKVLVGGNYSAFNGESRSGVARIEGGFSAPNPSLGSEGPARP